MVALKPLPNVARVLRDFLPARRTNEMLFFVSTSYKSIEAKCSSLDGGEGSRLRACEVWDYTKANSVLQNGLMVADTINGAWDTVRRRIDKKNIRIPPIIPP